VRGIGGEELIKKVLGEKAASGRPNNKGKIYTAVLLLSLF